ncbi:MAG: 3-carboxy-cis,cis-muconate cycloisomerase, partial [Betaproteobacteria bacterium]|nr:3-carboxy-cis,cis-muconate cycloisomerase [Betaproteobacteria bacterium]
MPSIVIEGRLFGEMFGTNKMRALFTDEAIVRRYLEVEAALARAQAKVGLIPRAAADAITSGVTLDHIDWP